MRIDVLTLFPEMFEGVFGSSLIGKARERGIVTLNAVNFRDFSESKHKTVDDAPYGGGGGMLLKPEPLFAAVEHLTAQAEAGVRPRVILTTPQGETFTQGKARELAGESHLIFICGHYEGVDERVREHLANDELSIGDYVLTGGELPAMVMIDAIVRLLPGVLGNEASAANDSFSDGLLEYPQYTRPADFRGWKVPDVLLSGNHAEIAKWRRQQSLLRTLKRRPDLLAQAELTPEERRWIRTLQEENE
jgi:tRNA (guanine37-N1)-methyltransferase